MNSGLAICRLVPQSHVLFAETRQGAIPRLLSDDGKPEVYVGKAPEAINMLFTGGNTGKLIVKL